MKEKRNLENLVRKVRYIHVKYNTIICFNIDFSLIPSLKQILELCLNKDIKIIVTSANALNKMMRKEN